MNGLKYVFFYGGNFVIGILGSILKYLLYEKYELIVSLNTIIEHHCEW